MSRALFRACGFLLLCLCLTGCAANGSVGASFKNAASNLSSSNLLSGSSNQGVQEVPASFVHSPNVTDVIKKALNHVKIKVSNLYVGRLKNIGQYTIAGYSYKISGRSYYNAVGLQKKNGVYYLNPFFIGSGSTTIEYPEGKNGFYVQKVSGFISTGPNTQVAWTGYVGVVNDTKVSAVRMEFNGHKTILKLSDQNRLILDGIIGSKNLQLIQVDFLGPRMNVLQRLKIN